MTKQLINIPMNDFYPPPITSLEASDYDWLIQAAFKEDDSTNDITTNAIFDKEERADGFIFTKQSATLAGINIAQAVFSKLNSELKIMLLKKDGDHLSPGDKILEVSGNLCSILTAERIALNFISYLSGIATRAYEASQILHPMKIQLLDTRKTLPGYRKLAKYAVTMGKGRNHRLNLSSMAMLKDNHIAKAGSIEKSVEAIRKLNNKIPIEVEVDNLSQLKHALATNVKIILLDNMNSEQLKECVATCREYEKDNNVKVSLEASGGYNLQNLNKLLNTDINYVSMGSLTMDVKTIDFSLEFSK